MTRLLFRLGWYALLGGAGLVAALIRAPEHGDLAFDAYILFLGGLGLLALVRATQTAPAAAVGPSSFEQALAARPAPSARPAGLERLEREVLLATELAFDVHYRLRPVLREVAAHRLATRLGIDLDRHPDAARAALGEPAWDLVRPDRPAPLDRSARGTPLAQIAATVTTLERI